MEKTILVNNGHNGHKIAVYTKPTYGETANAVKLRVAEKGKEYMFKWVYRTELVDQ